VNKLIIIPIVVLCIGFWGCDSRKGYDKQTKEILSRWDDANKIAGSTSRISLSNPVSKLQEIKREAKSLKVARGYSECHNYLLEYMDATIDGYLAFMRNDDTSSELFLMVAKLGLQKWENCLLEKKKPLWTRYILKDKSSGIKKENNENKIEKIDSSPFHPNQWTSFKDLVRLYGEPLKKSVQDGKVIYAEFNIGGLIYKIYFDSIEHISGWSEKNRTKN